MIVNMIMCEIIFGYRKYDSVTQALFETKVPSFVTVLHNTRCVFRSEWTSCCNRVVSSLCNIKIRLNSAYYAVCCCSVLHIVVCLVLLLCGCSSVSVLWS